MHEPSSATTSAQALPNPDHSLWLNDQKTRMDLLASLENTRRSTTNASIRKTIDDTVQNIRTYETLVTQRDEAEAIYGDGSDWEEYLREVRESIEMKMQGIRQQLDSKPVCPDFLSDLKDPFEGEERQMCEASRLDQYETFFKIFVDAPEMSYFGPYAREGLSAIQSYRDCASSGNSEGQITSLSRVMIANWEMRQLLKSSQVFSSTDSHSGRTLSEELTAQLNAVSLASDSKAHSTGMDLGE